MRGSQDATRHPAQRVVARVGRNVLRVTDALRRLAGRSPGAVEGPTEATAEPTEVIGWAHCGRTEIAAVVVCIDGRAVAATTPHVWRPDVVVARPSARNARPGWSAVVDLRGLEGTRVVIDALAVTRTGLVERLRPLALEVRPLLAPAHPVRGWIDRPKTAQAVLPDVVAVEGWAVAAGGVARVELTVDGEPAGRARLLAAPRPDIAATSPEPCAPLAGFAHTIDLSGREPAKPIRLEADVTSLDGARARLRPVDVRIESASVDTADAEWLHRLRARIDAIAGPRDHNGSPSLRLLVCTHDLGLGGGQLYLHELLRQLLVDPDVSCLVLVPTDGPLRPSLEALGAVVHLTGPVPIAEPGRYESSLLELARVARLHDCNVALVNTMSAAMGADLASRLRIPAVWAIHESLTLGEFWLAAYGEGAISPYVRERFIHALGTTAAVVFEADATRRHYEVWGDHRRFLTVRYGISLTEIDEYRERNDRAVLREARGISNESQVLLCLGTFEPRKAQGMLVRAFAEIADEFPDVLLAMVGDNATLYARGVHDLIRRLALESRVATAPVTPDVYAWYAIADAFVIASDMESLPRSMLEAMAFEIPILATDVSGIPEVIEDGVTGLLVEPRDLEAMVAGLRRVLAMTPSQRGELGAAGARVVRARFDSSNYAADYRKLLRGLVSDPSAFPAELLST
jgi:glycosyltransferase involved in cell wall biosynthesis